MDNLSLYLIIYIVVSQLALMLVIAFDLDNLFFSILMILLFPIIGIYSLVDLVINKIDRKLNPPEPFDEDKFIERFNRVMNEDFGDDDKDEQTKDKEL